jgi:hypothetical protein
MARGMTLRLVTLCYVSVFAKPPILSLNFSHSESCCRVVLQFSVFFVKHDYFK